MLRANATIPSWNGVLNEACLRKFGSEPGRKSRHSSEMGQPVTPASHAPNCADRLAHVGLDSVAGLAAPWTVAPLR